MLTIVITTYNPNIKSFEKSLKSAIDSNPKEIIIVDDNSNEDFKKYLQNIKHKNVSLVINKENKGPALNGLEAMKLAKTKFVKKLDPDDKLNSKGIVNVINSLSGKEKIVFTGFKFKIFRKNLINLKHRWWIFNANIIYSTEMIKKINYNENVVSFHDDNNWIFNIINNCDESEIKYIRKNTYTYSGFGSTKPRDIIKKANEWFSGFEELRKQPISSKVLKFNIDKQMVFYEMLNIKLENNLNVEHKYKYFKLFGLSPKWLKKLITKIVI